MSQRIQKERECGFTYCYVGYDIDLGLKNLFAGHWTTFGPDK